MNTTCTYEQVHAAISAENPDAAGMLDANPKASRMLRKYLSSSPAQRQSMLDMVRDNPNLAPMLDAYIGQLNAVAASCVNY